MKSCRAGIYLFPRRPRLQLDPEPYERLRKQVLQRDGWRCQRCGGLTDLQVHHINPRGRLGQDTEENLISLCASCHEFVHSGKQKRSSSERSRGI